jgi:hypothetical protein
MKSKSSLLLSLAVGTVSMLGVGPRAHAQYRDSCPDTIRHDQREVDKAVDRYGYDSRQAQHERAELQRDAANCGYNEYGSQNQYYQGNRDDRRYQGNDGYGDGYRDSDRRGERYDPAYENGYRDGMNIGRQDTMNLKMATAATTAATATKTSTRASTGKAFRTGTPTATAGSEKDWLR